jgi:hypothetical protein
MHTCPAKKLNMDKVTRTKRIPQGNERSRESGTILLGFELMETRNRQQGARDTLRFSPGPIGLFSIFDMQIVLSGPRPVCLRKVAWRSSFIGQHLGSETCPAMIYEGMVAGKAPEPNPDWA